MKKFFHLMFSVLLVFCAASGCFAAYYDEGHGGFSESDAYIIDSIADLVELRDRVNSGEEPEGAYYRMNFANKTVNLTEYTSWEMIGNFIGDYTFKGHFDGNSPTIYMNISVNSRIFSALFGGITTSGGYAIKNLNVDASGNYIITGRYVAGIADNLLSNASIENCTFSGRLSGYYEYDDRDASLTSQAGGIVRFISAGTIKDCKVTRATITAHPHNDYWWSNSTYGEGYAGGIVASMAGGNIENCSVENSTVRAFSTCRHEISESTMPGYSGGIVGYGSVDNSTIKNCSVSGKVFGPQYCGGIFGYFTNGTFEGNDILSGSTISGDIYTGGIGGYLNGTILRNSTVNSSKITSVKSTAGGIAGVITSGGILENCEITVGSNTTSNGTDVGGIVGVLGGATVRNNTSYSAISGSASHKGGIIGKIDNANPTISGNKYSGAAYGIGYDAGGSPSDNPGCEKISGISITTTSLSNGTVGTAYSYTLTANVSGVTWSVKSGNFPSEFTLDPNTGEIFCSRPATANTYNFTVQAATDYDSVEKSFTLTINAAPLPKPSITTTKLKAGKVGKKYTPKVKASGRNITWSASGLPAGVEINPSTGKFSGLPENSGTYNVRVTATNSGGSDTKTFSVVINDIKPNIKGKAKAGKVGIYYLAEFYTTKGTGNIVWTLTPEDLPEGLEYEYDTEGLAIYGTPEETWKQKYTLTATNSAGSKTKKFTLKIKK